MTVHLTPAPLHPLNDGALTTSRASAVSASSEFDRDIEQLRHENESPSSDDTPAMSFAQAARTLSQGLEDGDIGGRKEYLWGFFETDPEIDTSDLKASQALNTLVDAFEQDDGEDLFNFLETAAHRRELLNGVLKPGQNPYQPWKSGHGLGEGSLYQGDDALTQTDMAAAAEEISRSGINGGMEAPLPQHIQEAIETLADEDGWDKAGLQRHEYKDTLSARAHTSLNQAVEVFMDDANEAQRNRIDTGGANTPANFGRSPDGVYRDDDFGRYLNRLTPR